MTRSKNVRKPIAKSLRFEIFKRDQFKCQYCGAEAPNALLQIDHIDPVSNGGMNDITNLITACSPCNLGKGNRPLNENAAVEKARAQIEELQERREQLEFMMAWREGLKDIQIQTVQHLIKYWQDLAPGWSLNDNGKQKIRKWLNQFSIEEITSAMDIAASQYLEFGGNGRCTDESWEKAFSKILGICRVSRASKDNPDLKELYYIRGILRNRITGYFDDTRALQYLKNARSWDISLEELSEMARDIRNWSGFVESLSDSIREAQERLGHEASAE